MLFHRSFGSVLVVQLPTSQPPTLRPLLKETIADYTILTDVKNAKGYVFISQIIWLWMSASLFAALLLTLGSPQAYPYQLWKDPGHIGLGDRSVFRFYACSGAKTGGVVNPPDPGKDSQVAQMQALPPGSMDNVGFSTLSIGGNNVGFSRVLKSCIFFDLSSCGEERARTESRIASAELQTNLTNTYRQIIALMPVINFKLYVTGYAKFFNAVDERCNDKKFVPAFGAELTTALREWVNDDVIALNIAINQAINTVNQEMVAAGSQKFIRYVDIDAQYENHRFCDPWPNWKSDAWFFAPATADETAQTGTSPNWNYSIFNDTGTVDLTQIDPDTCTDDADNNDDWGQMFMCGFAQYYAENNATVDPSQIYYSDPSDGDALPSSFQFNLFLPTWIEKSFHPKSIGLGSEAFKIWLYWFIHY